MGDMLLTQSTNLDLGDKSIKIRRLVFKEQRALLPIVNKLLGAYDPKLEINDCFLFAVTGGAITEADLETLAKAFGAVSTVDLQDGINGAPSRELLLSKDEGLTAAFGDDISRFYDWLDACIKFHYADMIAKSQGVIRAVNDAVSRIAPQTSPTSTGK